MTQSSQSGSACDRCGDTGKLRYENDIFGPDGSVVGHERGTNACPCVRDLPPVEGPASWWDLRTVLEEHFAVPIGNDVLTVKVDVEVPRGDDGRARWRTEENIYYPALVNVECPQSMMLHADTARELGELLIKAADMCEGADAPVVLP